MEKLAIHGGKKIIEESMGKEWPIYGEDEEKILLKVLKSGIWWRGGYEDQKSSQVGQFEETFAKYHDAKHAIAVTNGTAALECALRAVGVEAGDEVLVPALTFVASATSIVYTGGIPVFVDVDAETFNMDPDAMEQAITKKTKAAVVVHNGGYPADMDRICEISKKHDVKIIEDSAHAHGSEWKGVKIGALGDMGTFSFQMGKTLTCGEGGIILTNDDAFAEKAFSIHHIGRIKGRPFYEFHRIGSNLRMTEWQGAILNTQFARFDKQIAIRENNMKYLVEGMKEVKGLRPMNRDPRVTKWGFYYWNFHYIQEEFDDIPRDTFIKAAAAEGLATGAGAHGKPIYENPVFQDIKSIAGHTVDYSNTCCPVAERLFEKEALSIEHRIFLGDKEDMDKIIQVFKKIRENTNELK